MENIQNKMKVFWGSSCYAYCLAYLNGNRTLKDLTKAVLEYWYNGYVEDDGFVTQPQKIMNCKDVQHVPYVPTDEEQIVCWEYNGGTHFVIMKGKDSSGSGKVVFDPSGDSNSVKYGKIKNARKFIK